MTIEQVIYVAHNDRDEIVFYQDGYTQDDLLKLLAVTGHYYLSDHRRALLIIRPITVTTTDGIIGKRWDEVDTMMLRLRACFDDDTQNLVSPDLQSSLYLNTENGLYCVQHERFDEEWQEHDHLTFLDALCDLVPLSELRSLKTQEDGV